MATMKAVRMSDYGGPEVLRVETTERPSPGSGELLVRVVAAGVNPIDWKVRSGMLKTVAVLRLPWTPGADFSGVVEEVGSSVSGVKKGDEVYGKADLPRDGSYAEYVVVPRAHAAAKPHTIDHVKAAAVPLAAMTAWQAMFGGAGNPSLELAPGQTLMVLGASGGVGSFAVQIAVARGARVIGVVRAGPKQSEEEAFVKSLGASDVLEVESMRECEKVDAVLDLVGGDVQARAWSCIRDGGAFASTVGTPTEAQARERGVRAVAVWTQTSGSQLDEIRELIDAGKVRAQVDQVLGLDEVAKAHAMLEKGGVKGKIVLRVE